MDATAALRRHVYVGTIYLNEMLSRNGVSHRGYVATLPKDIFLDPATNTTLRFAFVPELQRLRRPSPRMPTAGAYLVSEVSYLAAELRLSREAAETREADLQEANLRIKELQGKLEAERMNTAESSGRSRKPVVPLPEGGKVIFMRPYFSLVILYTKQTGA